MPQKNKVSTDLKIEIAKACAEGRMPNCEAARRVQVDESLIREWVARYVAEGPLAFHSTGSNQKYSADLKRKAVEEYLAGNTTLLEVSVKYGLKSKRQLQNWIKRYNSGIAFEQKLAGGSRMRKGRYTTKEERINIVKECLNNDNNYAYISEKYEISYQQIYTWVRKFKELGEAGLDDRRGKRTITQEPRTELEKAQIRIAQLEHELYMTQMERDLLKKLDEVERRDAFRK